MERSGIVVRCSAVILLEAPSSADRRGTAGVGHTTSRRGGDRRRFDTKPHQFYDGIDLHARTRYLGIFNQDGESGLHHHLKTAPEPFLQAVAPSREDLVVCVECLFTWYGLADLCARDGIPCVLGQALYRKALHGGQANNDTIDAHTIAVLRRGGLRPQASVYPAARRATRDLLRRRRSRTRQRAELLAHSQHTNRPYNLPESGQKRTDTAKRDGVAARFPAPAVQTSMAVDLARIGSYDQLLGDVELHIVTAAKPHNAQPLYLLQTVPGIGTILSLILRYERHDIQRCPRGQEFLAYGRLVKGATASAGNRSGTARTKIGNAYLPWAFAEAAVWCLRAHPAGQQ
jgi:transposase